MELNQDLQRACRAAAGGWIEHGHDANEWSCGEFERGDAGQAVAVGDRGRLHDLGGDPALIERHEPWPRRPASLDPAAEQRMPGDGPFGGVADGRQIERPVEPQAIEELHRVRWSLVEKHVGLEWGERRLHLVATSMRSL